VKQNKNTPGTIGAIGFKAAPHAHDDHDVSMLLLCLRNGWSHNPSTYIRESESFIEVCVVISSALDRLSIESLIRCDDVLKGLAKRKFQVGELMPGDLAKYVLITIARGES